MVHSRVLSHRIAHFPAKMRNEALPMQSRIVYYYIPSFSLQSFVNFKIILREETF
jgi:hypothetical protein